MLMMPDDVYGRDRDRFPLEQELADDDVLPELEWDRSDKQDLAAELTGRHALAD